MQLMDRRAPGSTHRYISLLKHRPNVSVRHFRHSVVVARGPEPTSAQRVNAAVQLSHCCHSSVAHHQVGLNGDTAGQGCHLTEMI